MAPLLPALAQDSGEPAAQPESVLRIPGQTPLRIQVKHTVPLKIGTTFDGKLLEPVYGPDRMLLPAGLVAHGVVAATPDIDRTTRMYARLDGDFTPLHQPVIRVTELVLPSGAVLRVSAVGDLRDAAPVSLARAPQKSSLASQATQQVKAQVKQARQTMHDVLHGTGEQKNRADRLRKMLYAQLPYHPQRMWAGSSFDAVLAEPIEIPAAVASQPSPPAPKVDLASGTMHARLTATLSSAAAAKGDAVHAVLTEPFLDGQGRMMLPTGTALNGVVVQSQRARWFARNGKLRFSFRSIAAPADEPAASPDAAQTLGNPAAAANNDAPAPVATTGPAHRSGPPLLTTRSQQSAAKPIDGHLHSIDALDNQNVTLDSEGGAHAQADKGKFLAPLVLAVLGAASQSDDERGGSVVRQGVTSNGFGIPARVLTAALASPNLASGFAAYGFSKSVYRRWIARGHEVTFPRYTELSIDLGRR